MLALRSFLINVFFTFITLACCIVAIPTFVLPKKYFFMIARFWSTANLFMLRVVGNIRYEFRGLENLPTDRPFIFAPKHMSAWDVFAFFQFIKEPVFAIKKELIYVPFFGQALMKSGAIALDRGSGGKALRSLLEGAEKTLSNGDIVMIFPEGTRTMVGAPPDYKYGVSYLYDNCQVPVVPCALNSGVFWARRRFLKYPGTIIAQILPPIEKGMDKREFAAHLQDQIETASNALIKEAHK